jgi:hypothetical protein
MPKHTYAINLLSDELERTVRNVLYLQKCIGKVQKHLDRGTDHPQTHRSHKLRLENSLKEQVRNSEKIKAAIKVLEEDK